MPVGMRSLFADLADPKEDRRRLPAEIRQAIVALKAEYPAFGLREIAAICQERFDRPVSHHTVKQVLTTEPLPLHPPRRFPRYHEITDPVARRRAVVTLYLDGWSAKAIAGYLETSRATVYDVLRRWDEEGWPGLADRPLGPRHPAGKVDLKAMAAIRRLQANPELGEFRIHAALAQQGIHLSPRTCGRILALHRALGAPQPAAAHAPRPAADAVRRPAAAPVLVGRYPLPRGSPARHRQAGLRDLDPGELQPRPPGQRHLAAPGPDRLPHRAAGGDRDPRRAGGVGQRQWWGVQGQPRQGHLHRPRHRAPQIDPAKPGRTTSRPTSTSCAAWPITTPPEPQPGRELQAVHERFFHDYNQQAHFAHRTRTDGRHSPAAVLGWVQGAWCDPADLDRLFRLRATRRLNPTGHASPQPFLASLAEIEWHPAQRLAPYRPRRPRRAAEQQVPLPEPDRETASG